jgi:hypothetical protein
MKISYETGLPVVFDVFHHTLYNSGESIAEAFESFVRTWSVSKDGIPMIDYSSRRYGGSPRQHAESIDLDDFRLLLKETESYDFDIMLEIKDKEQPHINRGAKPDGKRGNKGDKGNRTPRCGSPEKNILRCNSSNGYRAGCISNSILQERTAT